MGQDRNKYCRFSCRQAFALSFLVSAYSFGQDYPLSDEGFALPSDTKALEFPEDHGSHPEFKSEWWYLTGHLEGPKPSEQFGFQLTFFRSATVPADQEPEASQPRQIYMAHAAALNKSSGEHFHEERFNRGEWNANAEVDRLSVFNGNWRIAMVDDSAEEMRASFSINGQRRFELSLRPSKPKVLFGENGISRKGENPNAKSYYITFSRLEAEGKLTVDQKVVPVTGVAWMDHEISSSQLSEGQIGWNWSSLILDDGSELMAYVMRRDDGSVDAYSQMYIIEPDGNTLRYSSDEFKWSPIDFWTSPRNGARYPIEYSISWINQEGQEQMFIVRSTPHNQEIYGAISGFTYYEGAGSVYDENGLEVGKSYTELTGYVESLYGRF
ncbi:MAG TPA: hypothetical protein DIV79_16570 [Opitutae bacterium]|nr:hypothetical protein [Opitutaceae bacterium]HCR31619.1 hypothetical protein [Opitutae bacterium]